MRKALCHIFGYTVAVGIAFYVGLQVRGYIDFRPDPRVAFLPSLYLGKPAPRVVTTSVNSELWDLRQQAGKVVVIEMWATWCVPCVARIPRFQHLNNRFQKQRDFVLVGVSLDGDASVVKKFCAAHGMAWEQLVEQKKGWDNSAARAFEVQAVPFTCVVDKKGVVRYYDDHPLPTDSDAVGLEAIVQKLLSEQA